MAESRIVSDTRIMMGKPVVRGTRITVEHLLRMAALGLAVADIIREHPRLTEEDVKAAFSFAAELMRDSWLKSQPDGVGSWQSDGPEWATVEFLN